MQVILLEKVRNLGNLGDTVKVKAGYGRNYLIPEGKAVPATTLNSEKFAARRAELEAKAQEVLNVASNRAQQIVQLATVTIATQAGDEGKLYGSVGTIEIAQALELAGVAIEKREIRLPTGAIRQTGEYDIEIHLHSDVVTTIKLVVEAS